MSYAGYASLQSSPSRLSLKGDTQPPPWKQDPLPESDSHVSLRSASSAISSIQSDGTVVAAAKESAQYGMHLDAKIILVAKAVRMASCGCLAVMLVLYLEALHVSAAGIGALFTATLLGDTAVSVYLLSHADMFGRKKTLIISALLSLLTSVVFYFYGGTYYVLLAAAVVGLISPSGNECGPFMSIELAGLAQVSSDEDRGGVMRAYNLLGCIASALGAVLCGATIVHLNAANADAGGVEASYRLVIGAHAALQLLLFILYNTLGDDVEVPFEVATVKTVNPVTLFVGLRKSQFTVLRISALFATDAFANAFVIQSLVSAWFDAVYRTNALTLGIIVGACNITAGVASLIAAPVSDALGLHAGMALTSLPGNLLLLAVPFMPSERAAIAALCLRFCVAQLDLPARHAHVQGVVNSDERGAANGVTNVMRSLGAAAGPAVAFLLAGDPARRNYLFFVAGGLKIANDVLLLCTLQCVRPAHERAAAEGKRARGADEASPLQHDDDSMTT